VSEATITRRFDAPIDDVWRYFTEPELFAAWFGTPPYTTPPSRVSLDVTAGGRWEATMVHESDGSELPFRGEYVEVRAPERLVMIFEDVDNPENELVETLTLSLADVGDGQTEVTYHQTGHMPAEQYPAVEEGVGGFFDRLAQHLASA
jgi:uncharacterized protein YndB with AHSA1/START domain